MKRDGSRRDRFENLEAPRADAPVAEKPRVSGRFSSVDAPAPARPEVDELRGEGRRQLRCAECGRENGRYAGTCTKCGTPLDTRATRRLNERLFQDERAAGRGALVVAEAAEPAPAPPAWRRRAVIAVAALALGILLRLLILHAK